MNIQFPYHRWVLATLVTTALLLLVPLPSVAQEPVPLTLDQARQSAVERLQAQVELGHTPEWDGATLGQTIHLHDLAGEISAYLFPVQRAGENAGYLIVAALSIPNPVIEFSPMAAPPYSATRSLAEEKTCTEGLELCIERPLYLGPLSYGYELARPGECGAMQDDSLRRVLDLSNGRIIEVDAQQAQIPLREMIEPANSFQAAGAMAPAAYKLIGGVPDYCQFQGSYGCWSGCAPTASANVMGYWDGHGYPSLQSGGDWQGLVNALRSYMDTYCSGGSGRTSIGDISPGIVNYAGSKGYYFESKIYWPSATYSLFQSEINADRPIVVDLFSSADYWGYDHTVTGVGYQTSGSYMIVHDALWCGSNQGDHYIHYGSGYYSSIGMHPVSPDQTPPSKASSVRPDGWTGPYTNDSTPRFRWDAASDSGSGIAGYYVAVDDWTPEGSYGNDWWVGNVTAFTIPDAQSDGEHILAVTSRDNAGNVNPTNTNQQGDAPYYTFYVDTIAPTNPTSADSGCGAQDGVWQRDCTDADFTWSGADDSGGSGVQDYHVYWGTDPDGVPNVWRVTADHNPGPISIAGGVAVYYLRISTRDNLNHESAPGTIFTLRYDSSAPTGNPVINDNVETVHSVNVLVEPNGQDTGSGLASIHLSNDGENWQTQDYASTLQWTLLPHNRTLHTVRVEMEDNVGNRSRHRCLVCLDLYPAHPASTGYRLWGAGPTVAGGQLTSTHYRLDQTVGQSSGGGLLASTSYQLRGGFQEMWPTTPGEEMFTVFHCSRPIYLPLVVRNR